MKVYLHDTQTGLYFAAPGRWVKEQEEAMDLQTVEHAEQVYEAEHFPFVEIVREEGPSSVSAATLQQPLRSDLKP